LFLIAWQRPDEALAFALDGAWAAEQLSLRALSTGDADAALPPLWPESLMRQPSDDGARLLRTIDGFEGQFWASGLLRASRWWHTSPDAQEWAYFLRSAGVALAGNTSLPAPQQAAWLNRPYLTVRTGATVSAAAIRAQRWWLAAALGPMLFVTGAFAHQAWRVNEAATVLSEERDRLSQTTGPVLASRDRALALATDSSALAAAMTGPMPLEVLQHLSAVLPSKGVALREFDLSGSTLRVALEAASDISRSELITRLQSGGWLTQVSESRSGQRGSNVVLEMQLAGPTPSRVAADTGLTRTSDALPAPPDKLAPPVAARP
jgi:Tfp pilus assembly protein PilN